ncbi:hypothetical protein DB30_03916 [Enhygromyxa salina]|uniref:Uncharacterized protein n=1 Tax=Enhygromyxa salina TaxID=215803 RepID=A0A0C2DAM2_9BACT|nr:hypothetical protein [Enhygromyxa salina]KIG16932.1 hypothetical protein DB30_03916 [Enhygromyxa salina]
MRNVSAALLALGLGLVPGCRSDDAPTRQVADRGAAEAQDTVAAPTPGHTLRAAGVELTVPLSWNVVDAGDPNFALAWGPTKDPSHVSLCTIEQRRQGAGPLPPGVEPSPSAAAGATDYSHGPVRGRLRELPGPTPSAVVLVHCRAHRQTGQWGAIEAAFGSLKIPQTPAALPDLVSQSDPSDQGIAELCVATPARQTIVCARRANGAVYCGPSTGEVLTRVEGLPPAVQLSCERMRSCSRDAEGQVSCWRPGFSASDAGQAPSVLSMGAPARDIAAGSIVDARGRLLVRRQKVDGSTTDALVELLPLGEAGYALTDVERVLADSDEDHGCVLRRVEDQSQLWCWDHAQTLGLGLDEPGHPQRVQAPTTASALAVIGGRVCVGTSGEWTCLDGDEHLAFDGCERRACGCSLVGATRMSCDTEPHDRIDSRVFGRISDVVAAAGACVARLDGTVVCRGPARARANDDARVTQAVAGGVPGVAHVLDLRERDP